jgi:hypothetical protein
MSAVVIAPPAANTPKALGAGTEPMGHRGGRVVRRRFLPLTGQDALKPPGNSSFDLGTRALIC